MIRRSVLVGAVFTALAVLGLIVAGLAPIQTRSFVLGARPLGPILGIDPPQRLCEGPITSERQFDIVQVWGAALAHHQARVRVTVTDAHDQHMLGSGPVTVTDAAGLYAARLDRPVVGGVSVQVCVNAVSDHYIALGTAPITPSVVLTGHPGQQFSLNLVDDHESLLGALPRALSRAALWRPSWVGEWTFWVLAAGVLLTFAVAVVAVTRAAREDGANGIDAESPESS